MCVNMCVYLVRVCICWVCSRVCACVCIWWVCVYVVCALGECVKFDPEFNVLFEGPCIHQTSLRLEEILRPRHRIWLVGINQPIKSRASCLRRSSSPKRKRVYIDVLALWLYMHYTTCLNKTGQKIEILICKIRLVNDICDLETSCSPWMQRLPER